MSDAVAAFRGGRALYEWHPLDVSPRLRVWVFRDAARVDGVRVAVSAREAQQCADAIGATLTTPLVEDLIWSRADVRIEPLPGDPARKSAAQHSGQIDAALADRVGLICTVGKSWVLTRAATDKRAVNYGWHGNTARYASATLPGIKVWQPASTAHNLDHRDYCVAPQTRVLTADMRWVPAGELSVGDEIVGFDEELSRATKFRGAAVLSAERRWLECVEIVTEWGPIVATLDHRWVGRPQKRNHSEAALQRNAVRRRGAKKEGPRRRWRWVRSEDLTVGSTIAAMVKPWEVDESREGGWMAGILDGEGWCSPPDGVGVAQNHGPVLDAIRAKFKADGFRTAERDFKGCVRVTPNGQRSALRVLGRYRPIRLLHKARQLWENSCAFTGGRERVELQVLSVRRIGVQEVVALQTSTKTLVCEGLLSHNSQTLRLMRRRCVLDGHDADVRDVLIDAELYRLLSTERLTTTRQPGVDAADDRPPDTERAPPVPGVLVLPETIIYGRPPVPVPLGGGDVRGVAFRQARNFTPGRRGRVRNVVIHTAECGEVANAAENLAAWAAGPQAPRASWHYAVDADSVTQSVREADTAWHAPGVNGVSIGIEHAGRAGQNAAGWADAYSAATLARSAALVAGVCARHGVPLSRVGPTELLAGAPGICGHADVSKAFKRSDHWDPGTAFPWDAYLAAVRGHA